LAFGVSTKHYDMSLFTEDNKLTQEVFDIIHNDMKLTYEKTFLLKSF